MRDLIKSTMKLLSQSIVYLSLCGLLFMFTWNGFAHAVLGFGRVSFVESVSALLLLMIVNATLGRAPQNSK